MNNDNNLYNILNNFNKLSESDTPKPAAQPKDKTLLESTMEEVLQEKYMGFKKTVAAIAKNPKVDNPEAVAASIGRKKYGKKAFQKAAAAGKKMGESAPHPKELEMDAKVRSMQIQNRADAVEKRRAEKAKEPQNVFQKVKKDIGEPLAKLAKGDIKGAFSENRRDAYQRDYDSSVSGMGTDHEFRNRERNAGLEDEKNNYAVYIDGRQWKVFADKRQAENIARSLTNKGKNAKVYVTGANVSEGEEGHAPRLSIGQQMARDGITYSPKRENELIDLMAQYMKNNGMSPRAIRYYLSYDEDYISDQLSDLPREGMTEESDWSNLGIEYRSTKPGTKEPTHTGEKEYFKGGVKHTKDYDREVSHTAATGEKRGRGRPKKSQFEGHNTIDKLIAEAFGEEEHEQSLNYEQDQLRNAIGDDLFAELQRSASNGDYDFSDDLFQALHDHYFDEMPPGTRKARDGDPYEWIGNKISDVFSDNMSEGSIKGGVWSADPPAPGQPNVPMPKGDPEGVTSTPKSSASTPKTGTSTNEPRKASPGWGKDDYKPLIPDTSKGSSMGTIKGGTWQADPKGNVPAPSGDPEGVQEEDKNTEQKEDIMMTNELAEMMRLAGMSESKGSKPDYLDFDKDGDKKEPMKQALKDKKVDEAEEKADKDYDGDGKIESGKDEYLGSKIAAAKKAGKLKEGTCKSCHKDPCVCKEEKCMECGMYESKCKCNESIEEALNQMRRIAGLKECGMSPISGAMGDMQQEQGKMNISTNMSSDGNKSVTITADGDSALELMQMLKLAGMGGHGGEEVDEQYLSEPIVAKPSPDDTKPAPTPAPPPAAPGSDGEEVDETKDPRYQANTTPEEHVYPEQVLTKGGDGEVAGKEKAMHKHGYKFGDNPLAMKESVSMKLMKEYESIKIKK